MNTGAFAGLLATIFRELMHGSSEPGARTYVLNQGDTGLLASLALLSGEQASESDENAPSVAAHVDHVRYGLMLLNRWAAGNPPPWPDMDWTTSWRKTTVSAAEWRTLQSELRREADAWVEVLRTPREVSDVQAGWMTGSVAHLAYHLGAIRQLDRTMRGPTAEDEAKAQAEHGSS